MTVSAEHLPSRLGPFAITGLLGEGGGGVVYAAERDGSTLALKVPRPGESLTERDQERLLTEARLLARVDHPAVVRVLGSGTLDDGRPYVAMERLVGRTLAERIGVEGALSLAEALVLFEQLAEATAALHDAGLVHRDLKAENVFLVDDGATVKLLDFGIAKDLTASPLTTTGVVRGTPATMAPERFLGAPATHASDIYELAVVLYVMLVGRLPWPEEVDVKRRLSPTPPREAGAPISEGLSQEIVRALSIVPEQRPPSARALLERVQGSARGRTSAPPPLSTVTSEHLRPWVDNPTPLDAAVPVVPTRTLRSVAGEEVAPAVAPPRSLRRYAVTALTGIALGAAAISAAPKLGITAVGAPVVRIAPSLARAVGALRERSRADRQQAADEPRAPALVASADAAEPRVRRSNALRRSEPATAEPETAASAAPAAPPPAPGTSIPGGVYEIAPYK